MNCDISLMIFSGLSSHLSGKRFIPCSVGPFRSHLKSHTPCLRNLQDSSFGELVRQIKNNTIATLCSNDIDRNRQHLFLQCDCRVVCCLTDRKDKIWLFSEARKTTRRDARRDPWSSVNPPCQYLP